MTEFRMPASGESWRHYKGALYTIVGLSRDHNGNVEVVYTSPILASLYNQPLGRFLQEVENNKPRFLFERESEKKKILPTYTPHHTQMMRGD